MLRQAAFLKRLNETAFLMIQGPVNRFVEKACAQVGLNTGVNGLWAMLVKPRVEFRKLFRSERGNRAFDLPDRV